MQTFKNPYPDITIHAIKVENEVWIAKKDVEELLRDITPFYVEDAVIEGQLYISAEDCLELINKSKGLGKLVLLQWFELNEEVMPHAIQQKCLNLTKKVIPHAIQRRRKSEPEPLWRRFMVTGTLEEIHELMEILRDKQLCHEEIALILSTMRLREEKE